MSEINEGWGRLTWGENSWGAAGDVVVSGQSLSTSIGSVSIDAEIGQGWGRKTWGNLAWGAAYSVLPTGLQTTISLGTALAKAGAKATVSNNLITSGFGVAPLKPLT